MAKFFIVYGLEFLIGLALLTQVIVPMFVKKLKFFWLFRESDSESVQPSSLEELNQQATDNKEQREKINYAVKTTEEVLREIKEKTN